MLAFLNTPTFPVFSPPTYFNPAFILRFYLSFIFYLAFIYCVLFTNIIYRGTDTCNNLKGHCIEFKYYADGIHSGLTPPGCPPDNKS